MSEFTVLFDVDNTLLNNDVVLETMRQRMREQVGEEHERRFWQIYEEVRSEADQVSVPKTLERFGVEHADLRATNRISEIIYGFDFAGLVYPGALEAVAHARQLGEAVILSDGDQLFQRHKIVASGLEEAVGGNVMVQPHKEAVLDAILRRFPAGHYVMLDDKPRLLEAMKRQLGKALTTVHVGQGKYARVPADDLGQAPDLELAHIGEFVEYTGEALKQAASAHAG